MQQLGVPNECGKLIGMDAAPSLSRNRKLFATACIIAAAGLVSSLNLMLPMTLEHRHSIGCGLMIVALILFLIGLAAVFGQAIIEAVVAMCRPWSLTKRIAVGATVYFVVGILCHASVELYQHVMRRWADSYLPESISWWFQ